MITWVEDVAKSRLQERCSSAIFRSKKVLQLLESLGVKARVVGSLAEDRFALHSDVDFLIENCPRQFKYSIESRVESVMLDIPFDVIYDDEMCQPPLRLKPG